MLPDRVSNPGPLIYESGALPIALRGLALLQGEHETSMKQTIGLERKHECLFSSLQTMRSYVLSD